MSVLWRARRAAARRPLAAAGLLLAALVTGCDDAALPAAPEARGARPAGAARSSGVVTDVHVVVPRAAADAPAVDRAAETLARFDFLSGQDGGPEGQAWEVYAPVWGVSTPDWLEPAPERPMLMAGARRREVTVGYRWQGPLDLTGVQRLVLVGTAMGAGGLGAMVAFEQGGAEVTRLQPVRFNGHASMEALTIPLPVGALPGPVVEAMSLRISGQDRQVGLAELLLQRVPPAAALPAPEAGPASVTLDDVARPAVPLVVGRPLHVPLPGLAGGRLELQVGQPAEAAHGGPVTVTVDDDGGEPWQRSLTAADGWVRLSLPWSADAGALTITADGAPGAAVAVTPVTLHVPRDDPPTVLLITSDTHRADHLGVSGMGVDVATPWLDGLAARGVRFADCFAPVNNTNPSHMALMTATHPRDTGVLDNYRPLTEVAETLAEAFAGAGWATVAGSSSKHLGPPGSGLGQGFEAVAWSTEKGQRDSTDTLADLLPLLDEADGRPLFVWLHVFDAHTPYEPPAEFLAPYYPSERDPRDPALGALPIPAVALPPELRDVVDLDYPAALYKGEVSYQDAQLARLASVPRLADAVTAFVADHGESHGENGGWFTHAGVYSASLHIPLLLAGPGVPVGQVVERPVQHLDLGRTLLDLAGLSAVPFPGASLLAAPAAARAVPRFALEANAASAAVTMDGWHLVLHLIVRAVPTLQEQHPRHAVELFDLATDPRCTNDLAAEHTREAGRLRRLLIDWLQAARPRGWVGEVETDAEALETLAQLGYAGPAAEGAAASLWTADDCEQCQRWDTR